MSDIDFFELYRRRVTFATGRANARDDTPNVLALVASGRLDPGVVPGNIIDIDDAPAVLPDALTHKTIIRM